MRVLAAIEPTDFRKGIDGLAQLCRSELKADPFSGWAFVFRNRRKTSIKILVYDGQGFCLFQKRLSVGKFRFWPGSGTDGARRLEAHQVQLLLSGGNPATAQAAPQWRRVSPGG